MSKNPCFLGVFGQIVVEMRRIELLSKAASRRASPGAVSVLFSRHGRPLTDCHSGEILIHKQLRINRYLRSPIYLRSARSGSDVGFLPTDSGETTAVA